MLKFNPFGVEDQLNIKLFDVIEFKLILAGKYKASMIICKLMLYFTDLVLDIKRYNLYY